MSHLQKHSITGSTDHDFTGLQDNKLLKFSSGSSALTNSIIYDNGTYVGFGTAAPYDKIHISGGTIRINDSGYTYGAGKLPVSDTNGSISFSSTTELGLGKEIGVACSDEYTIITANTMVARVTFRMPYAMTLTSVRASLTTKQNSGGTSTFTVNIYENGASIFAPDGSKLTIDDEEKTSTTAAVPPTIADYFLADDSEMTVFVDQCESTATGLKIWLIGYQTLGGGG